MDHAATRPSRFRGLKWIAVLCGVAVSALAGLRVAWDLRSRSVLQDAIERIATSGQPLYAGDFDGTSAAGGVSPTAKLIEAEEALEVGSKQRSITGNLLQIRKLDDRGAALLQQIFEGSAASRSMIREARLAGVIDHPLQLEGPGRPGRRVVEQFLNRELSQVRLLCAMALYHHTQADDAEALACVHDALWVSEHMGQLPYMYSHLWALYGTRWVVYYVEELSSHLRPEGQAPAAGVHELIRSLLQDRLTREQIVRAVQTERMVLLGHVEQILEGRRRSGGLAAFAPVPYISDLVERPLFEPAYRFDAARMLRHMTGVADALGAPDWPSARRALPARIGHARGLSRLIHPLSRRVDTRYGWHGQLHFRTLAMRRMAAIALAMRLYEIEHDAWPGDLQELAPRYIAEVPADPFAAAGAALSFAPDAEPAILYSVGPNGVDEGGLLPDVRDPRHWQKNDLPLFLKGQRPW